jgi:hypothetical protein
MKISELFESLPDPVLPLIRAVRKKFGRNNLMGGNCGMFSLGLAKYLDQKGVQLPLAVICYDAFDDEDDVTPSHIIHADVPVYHVALVAKPKFYDADGLVTGSHIQSWIKQEYQDSAPALFVFDLTEPGLESLIRTDTAWSIASDEFLSFFHSLNLNEGAYKGGLRKWFKQNWKDISREVDGAHPECGASAGKQGRDRDPQRAYPKCVPAAQAGRMTKKQKTSAVRRKRAVERKPGAAGKVDSVKT